MINRIKCKDRKNITVLSHSTKRDDIDAQKLVRSYELTSTICKYNFLLNLSRNFAVREMGNTLGNLKLK